MISESDEQKALDTRQRTMLGNLISVAGFGIIAMALIPNPMFGRMLFMLCGGIVLAVGILLLLAAREPKSRIPAAVV